MQEKELTKKKYLKKKSKSKKSGGVSHLLNVKQLPYIRELIKV